MPDNKNTTDPVTQAKQVVAEKTRNGLNDHLSAVEEAELKEEAIRTMLAHDPRVKNKRPQQDKK